MDEKKISIIKKRLMFQCMHRGTKEIDVLLGGYVKHHLENLSIQQLKELDLILKFSDKSLYLFITEKTKPPKEINNETLKNIIFFNKKLKKVI